MYALGVLLYELLTGVTPFDAKRLRSAAFGEMQRIIKEEDPPAPSLRLTRNLESLAQTAMARQVEPAKLSIAVRGELDWIVMKALDKDRARRYESAAQFAGDVGNHLAGETVEAAPPSRGYRVRKFVRRNKGAVIATSSVLCVFMIGLISTIAALRVAQFNAKAALHNAELATAARDELQNTNAKLEAQAGQARAGVGEMLSILSDGISGGPVDSFDPDTGESVFDRNPLGSTVGMGLDLARSLKEERDKLQLQTDIAQQAMDRISEIVGCNDCGDDESKVIGEAFYSGWKQSEQAEPFLGASEEELRMRALAAFAELQAVNLVAESDRSNRIAQAVSLLGDVQNEYVANRAAEDFDGNLADSDRSKLSMLLEELDQGLLTDSPEAEFSIRSALISLMEASISSEAIPFCKKTLQQTEQLFGHEHPITIRILTKLVSLHDQSYENKDEEQLAEARRWYEQLRQRIHSIRRDLPDHDTRQWASTLIDFSSQYSDTSWTASMVLGEPDAFSYTDHRGAWTPKTNSREPEHVSVGYEKPVHATGVLVREVLNNGFVRLIEVLDLDGVRHPVWAGEDTSEKGVPYDFVARFDRTPFAVRGVRVTIDGSYTKNWEEIDAIELLGYALSDDELNADANAKIDAREQSAIAMQKADSLVANVFSKATTLEEAKQTILAASGQIERDRVASMGAFYRARHELSQEVNGTAIEIINRFITQDRCRDELARRDNLSPLVRDEIDKSFEIYARSDPYSMYTRIWRVVHAPGASRETLDIAHNTILNIVDKYPKIRDYMRTYGVALYRLGDYNRALEILTKPNSLFTYDWGYLSMIYAKLGKTEEAIEAFDRWPENLRSADPDTEAGRIYTEMLEVLGPLLAERD